MLNPAPANAAVDAALLAAADLLTPNETEFAALLAAHTQHRLEAEAIVALDDASLHAPCRALLPHGTVVVTLGAGGCFVSHPDAALTRRRRCLLPRRGRARGGRRHHRRRRCIQRRPGRERWQQAVRPRSPPTMRFANRYAALSMESPGAAASMPRRDAVLARFGQD